MSLTRINLPLRSMAIHARYRKIDARWTVEHKQDVQAMYHLDLEDDLLDDEDEETNMKTVKVDKKRLLEILKKNREEHKGIFIEAQKAYREVAITVLDDQLKAAREDRPFELQRFVALTQPQDHTAEYDRAIQMLEMSVDDQILISENEFMNFVQDTWDWSRGWAISNAPYVSSNSRNYAKVSSALSSSM